jgi:osmoprotectant transport system substrate-binding protein
MRIKMSLTLTAGAVVMAALAACGSSSNPLASTPASASAGGSGSSSAPAQTVTVGSANFPESVLLGWVYAKALEAKGVKVTTKLNIGSREVIYKQVVSGDLSILPEYNGALLAYLDPKASQLSTADVDAALATKIDPALTILDPATAEDKDSLVVTQATATKYSLKAIPDLAASAKNLVIGGPPEFKTRQQGLLGLKGIYGLTFKSFKSLDVAGPITVAALKNGNVQAADLFSTDPTIVQNSFVVLADPKNLFGAQNIIPLVNKKVLSDTITAALNAVSAKLDTATLAGLVKKVVTDKADPDQVAADWLKSVGLA